MRAEGHKTLRAMVEVLNARGIRTRRGGRWHVSTVKNLLQRLKSNGGNKFQMPAKL
ncbi:recombinase-like helix-turn-helix domain-containing protein [Lutimaribacter marinistellae]|uniref:Recombinase-like helix-turn-helix domain-containing protein n=1 Tax=Lutimaribacter marinistellae TaxID=1820329 RepID=A0ABV7TMG8_9RHOB